MPWWLWLVLGWSVVAAACAAWWGLALANAELQDVARRITEDARMGEESPTV